MSPTLAGEHPIAVHPDQVSTTTARAIALTGVTKDFGEVQAVRGLDLTVRKGEVVAFLGPNGAGKTTTIDMVLACPSHDGVGRGLWPESRAGHFPWSGVRGHAARRTAQGPDGA